MKRSARIGALIAGAALAAAMAAAPVAQAQPTCSGLGGIKVHAQHVIGDYVTGLGGIGGGLEWPPAGQVGAAVSANRGVAVPGGPGPGFHFGNGFAPGASFCNEQAHPNGFTAPPAPGPPSP